MCTIVVFYVTYYGDFQLVDSMDRLSILPEVSVACFFMRILVIFTAGYIYSNCSGFCLFGMLIFTQILKPMSYVLLYMQEKHYLCYGSLSIL